MPLDQPYGSGLAAPTLDPVALAAGATGPGLAPRFARDPATGMLTRNGQPPDTMFPGGIPGWQAGPTVPVPPSLAPIYQRESGLNYGAQNPTSTASGAGQDIDSTWREAMHALGYGDKWAHAKDAPPDVQNAANIWLQGRYGNKPWAASEPGHGGVAYDQGKADIRAQEQEINAKIGGLVEQIGKLDARDPASLKELAHYREEMERYQQQALQLATHPPQFNPGQQMQQQGGMALVIGLLGGLLTKRPLIASMNAGAAALNAYNKGDQQEYQRNLDQWKVSTDAMFKMAEFEHQMYSDTLKDEKLTEGEKLDKLKAQAELLGNQRMILATQSHDLDAAEQHSFQYQQMLAQAKEKPMLFYDPDTKTWNAWYAGSGKTEPVNVPTGSMKGGPSAAAGGEWSKDAIDALVTQAMTVGPQNIMTSLPRGGPARKQFEEALAERLKDEPGGLGGGVSKLVMQQLHMAEAKAAATQAGRVTMNTQLYAAEAEGAAKLVVDASKLVPRTDLPAINAIEEAGLRQTGDPGIIRLGTAINSLLTAYGKMSNPTGTGIHDADKARLEGVLTAALSQGQVEAAVDQIVLEGRNVANAAMQAQVQVLAGLAPQAPQPGGGVGGAAPSGGGQAAPTPAAGSGKPPIIQNGNKFDPDTHQYLGPATQ